LTPTPRTLLVVAKAPVPGLAKTRLAATVGKEVAADLAAAALLDTLTAVHAADVTTRVVALTGDLDRAARSAEVRDLLVGCVVIGQRGDTLGGRLAAAHRDAGALAPGPLLQIGMDTPQVTPAVLSDAVDTLATGSADAVYGPATDGGWWSLGLGDPARADFLSDVAMSAADTGVQTVRALRTVCPVVRELPELTDVDVAGDVWPVARALGADSRFRAAAVMHGATRW
jgi:glycosyltransferase A (GT-A) superfamily protein (DUF2064 family)